MHLNKTHSQYAAAGDIPALFPDLSLLFSAPSESPLVDTLCTTAVPLVAVWEPSHCHSHDNLLLQP